MILRICGRQSYTGRIPGKRAKTDKVISVETLTEYQPEPCGVRLTIRLASGERSKRYDGFGQ